MVYLYFSLLKWRFREIILMNNALTSRQKEVLDFIGQCISERSCPPSLLDIQQKFSFKSPNAAKDHLLALERKGYIKREPHKSRSLQLIRGTEPFLPANALVAEGSSAVNIPIVGRVAAGEPIFAEQNIEGTLAVDNKLIKNPQDIFALRVKGNSMIDAGILDGDFVIVHKQSAPDYDGDTVVVLIDGEATVKKLYKEEDGKLRLQPANETMHPIIVNPSEKQVWIAGRVKGVMRKF
jgi:repressor LexA